MPRSSNAKPLPTIAYAILSSLAHESLSGYELSQLMGPPRNYMWEARHSQVYPALALLASHGHVVYTDVAQDSRPDKKVYGVTEAGRKALRTWALEGPTHVPVRDEFSLRLAALCALSLDEALSVLDPQIALVASEIDAIDVHLSDFAKRFDLPDPLPADHPEYGLRSAIALSRELKAASVARYRSMRDDLLARREAALAKTGRKTAASRLRASGDSDAKPRNRRVRS